MTKSLEHEVKPTGSLYWANVLRERDVLKGQLDAMEEQLAEKDARFAELETDLRWERSTWPRVGDWPEAWKLREAWGRASSQERDVLTHNNWANLGVADIAAALRAFCESAPHAPSPVREVVVESDAARKLRALLERGALFGTGSRSVSLEPSLTRELFDALLAFRSSAPPASAPSDEAELRRQLSESLDREARLRAQLDERTRQVAQLQDDLYDARYARDKAANDAAEWKRAADKFDADARDLRRDAGVLHETQCELGRVYAELAALKSAPARSEREVDAELRAALLAARDHYPAVYDSHEQLHDVFKRRNAAVLAWLAAPLSAPDAPDEYTRAAVKFAESSIDERQSYDDYLKRLDTFKALYDARRSAAASAPDGEKAAPAIEESTFDSKAVAPAPADGERVTVYVLVGKDGISDGQVCTEATRAQVKPYEGSYWLALDARVVKEGGGK